MNVNTFTDTITKDPHARASTVRFRQAAGTLWLKADVHIDEKQKYIPILSYMDTYIVDWGCPHSLYTISTRASSQLSDIVREVRKSWLKELAGPAEMGYPFPSISVRMNFPNSQMAVKKPSLRAVKSLLKGVNPDDGTTRYEWSRASTWDGVGAARNEMQQKLDQLGTTTDYTKWRDERLVKGYRTSFQKPLEDALTGLAYGAIKKENTLKMMTNPLFQLVETVYAKAQSMTEAMQECASRYFAPIDEASVANGTHHLAELNESLKEFDLLSKVCGSAANRFYRLATGPDSAAATAHTPMDEMWELNFPTRLGVLDNSNNMYSPWLDKEPWDTAHHCSLLTVKCKPEWVLREENGSEIREGTTLKDMVLFDHNLQSFSYYWFKKNLHKYVSVLEQIGCEVSPIFGEHPSEWDYQKIAAPLFLDEKSK